MDDIPDFIWEKEACAVDVNKIVAYLDVDVDTKMAIVNKIKERLQSVEQYELAYSAKENK